MIKASFYDFSAKSIDGVAVPMTQWRNQIVLIVNVASKCGFTPQYTGLEALYQTYKSRGFVILGFPCNQFGGQEPGSDASIKTFCSTSYNVSFPLFSRVDVNGKNADPLYAYLKSQKSGILGTKGIKWNFTKFLLDRQGNVLGRFGPTVKPAAMHCAIEALLG